MALYQGLQNLIDVQAARTKTHTVLLRVQSGGGRLAFKGSAGQATDDMGFPMASIAKMFAARLIMSLVDEGRIDLNQPVQNILTDVDLSHVQEVVQGLDDGTKLTLRHLLHQTSGLADYYESNLATDLQAGNDRSYGLEDVLQMTHALLTRIRYWRGRDPGTNLATAFQLLRRAGARGHGP